MAKKKYYAIKWTNSFGNRVFYPEQVWRRKANAKKFARKLKQKRLKSSGTRMRNIRIVKLS